MNSLELEEQVITEKHINVDMEAYIKFKLGFQPVLPPNEELSKSDLQVRKSVSFSIFTTLQNKSVSLAAVGRRARTLLHFTRLTTATSDN